MRLLVILLPIIPTMFCILTEQVYAEEPTKTEQHQQSQASDSSPSLLDAAGNSPLAVVVVASRGQEQDPMEIPQSVNSVSKEEIEQYNYSSVEEAIRRIPGVGMGTAGSTPNYWDQGFTIRGLGAQRVLTLSDGIRQSGQGIGYGGGNLSLYDTFGIEKIEVLKGPASVLYGTDSFGGVVNVITRNPRERDKWGINGSARYSWDSGYDKSRAGAYLDFGNEVIGTVIGGSFSHAGQPNLPDHEDPMGGDYRDVNIWGKSDIHFSDFSNLRLIANSSRAMDINALTTSMTLPIATFPPPGSSLPVTTPLEFHIPKYQRIMSGAEFTTENLTPGWELLKTGFYWQQISRNLTRTTGYYPQGSPGFAGPPLFYDPTATVNASSVRTDDETNTYEYQAQARYNLCDKHIFTIGMDLGYDNTNLPENETNRVVGVAGKGSINGPEHQTHRLRADAHQLRGGFYAQDTWKLDPFEVIPGVRVDTFSIEDKISDIDKDLTGVSGSIGTVYRPYDSRSWYSNIATGFRSPDLGERFQDNIVSIGAPTRLIGNPDLNPERAYSFEVGTKYEIPSLNYDVAGFFTRIHDFIGTKSIGEVDGFSTEQYENLGYLSLYGMEATTNYEVFDRVGLYFNASRTWATDTSKVDIFGWAFNYGIQYTQPVGSHYLKEIKTAVNLRTIGNSVDNTQTNARAFFIHPKDPDFTVVDYQLNFYTTKTSLGTGSIITGVKNIFNTKYYEPFFDLPQPGRYVYLGAQYEF